MPITIDELVYSVGLNDSDMRAGAARIEKTIRGLSQFTAGISGAFAFPLQMVGSWEAFGSAVRQAGQAVFEFSKEASVFDTVERSFMRLAASSEQSGAAILRAMKEATAGTVDSLTLMQQANQAFLLGLEVTPERMTQLMQIARGAAQSTGQSFDYMVESIIGGLGRQEREILDNLGIVVRADDAYQKYAASIGKTANQLTEAERKQAFMTEALRIGMDNLERAGGIQDTATEKFARMDVAIKDLQLSIGHLFAPATTSLLSVFASGISSLADGLEQLPPLFESAADKAQRLQENLQALTTETNTQLQSISDLQERFNRLNQRLRDENLTTDESKQIHKELNGVISKLIDTVPGMGAVFRKYGGDIQKVNEYLEKNKNLHAYILRQQQRESAEANLKAYKDAQQKYKEMSEEIERLNANYVKLLAMTEEEWRKQARRLTTRPSEQERRWGRSYQEFQEKVAKLGLEIDATKSKADNLNASLTVEARRLKGLIESVGLSDVMAGFEKFYSILGRGGKLTAQQEKLLQDYQAQLRDAFGVGIDEGNKLYQTLAEVYRLLQKPPKPPKGDEKGKVFGLSVEEVKQITKEVKEAITEFERSQRVAAKAAGEVYKPNLEAIQNTAREFVKAKLQEKGITDESVIYQKEAYGQLADYLLNLNDKVLKDRQQKADEELRTELDSIDRQIEAKDISYQQAIQNLTNLQQAHQNNARAIELIEKKTALFQRRQMLETQRASVDTIKKSIENLRQLKEYAEAGMPSITLPPAFKTWMEENKDIVDLYTDYSKKSASQRAEVEAKAAQLAYNAQKSYIQNNIQDAQLRAELIAQLDDEITASAVKAAQARVDAAKSMAQKVEAIEKELSDFRKRMGEATTQDALKSAKKQIDAFVEDNANVIEGNKNLKATVEEVNTSYDKQNEALFALRMALARIQNEQKAIQTTEAGAARARREQAREKQDAEKAWQKLLERSGELQKELAEEEEKQNKMWRRSRTPWGAIINITELESQLQKVTQKYGKFSKEWRDATEALEAQWENFFDMTQEGLETLVGKFDDTTEAAYRLVESIAVEDPFGAFISGLSLLKELLADTTPEFKKALDVRDYSSRIKYLMAEIDRLDKDIQYEEERLEVLKREGPGAAIPHVEAGIKYLKEAKAKYKKELNFEILIEDFRRDATAGMQDAWRSIFDPNNLKGPLEDFGDSIDKMLLEQLIKVFSEQSMAIPMAKQFGEYLSIALKDGITPTEAAEIAAWKNYLLNLFKGETAEFKKAATALGLNFAKLGREGHEQFIDSFASRLSSDAGGAIEKALTAGLDIANLGEDLAERFNKSFMNTIVTQLIEASALKPLLEKFGEDLYTALEDGVIDPVEEQMLKRERQMFMVTSEALGKEAKNVMRQLDIDVFKKEEKARAKRAKETEAFQTISSITRYQSNAIIAQLSLHSSYLKTIADTNAKIVELNNIIADNTRTMGQLQQQVNITNNGLDDRVLADRNLQQAQAQGLQI